MKKKVARQKTRSKKTAELDKTDRKIIDLLQRNGRLSNVDLAKQLGLTPPSALKRVRNLEKEGVIVAYHARVDPLLFNRKLLAFIFVRIEGLRKENKVANAMARIDGVLEVHLVAGEDALLLKVRTAGPDELATLIREDLSRIDGIVSTKTTIVLHTVQESFILPA